MQSPYAKPGPYNTTLTPDEESEFQQWTRENRDIVGVREWKDTPLSDYDMRGYWKSTKGQRPTAVNPNDNAIHFPDTYKTPYHESFSNESQYATADAPKWNEQDQLIDKTGRVVFDEKLRNRMAAMIPPQFQQNANAPDQGYSVNTPQPPPVQPQMMPPPQMGPQGPPPAMPPMSPSSQPYTVNPDMSQPLQPSIDDVAKIQDILANHAKASWSQRHMQAKSALVDALTNFTYAMGQGMQASAQYPGRRGSMAGMGAALAAPQQLQYIRNQQAMQQQQRQAEMIHAQAAQQNAQTLEGYRRAQEHNLEPTTITNPYTGESETVPANQVGKRLTDFAKMQADKDKSTNMLDLAYSKRGMKVIDPAKARSADNYAPMADDDPNLPQDVRALRQKETAANDLAKARTELAQAQAQFEKAKNDPNSLIFKQAQQRLDTAVENSNLARQNVVRLNNLQEANLYGTVGGQQLPGGPTDAQGQPIGLKVAQLANSLGGQAPQQIKMQIAAAMTTKDMIDVVRKLVAAKPYLIGPAAGRAAEAAQGIGTSFGLQDPQDEQDAALLSGHLGYLFANELRASFPNRPPREIIQMLKDKSAQMKDNPNILEGFLKSASNNADIALKTGAKFNIPQAAAALGQTTVAPTVPPPSGMSRISKPDGTVVDIPTRNVPAALKLGGKLVR